MRLRFIPLFVFSVTQWNLMITSPAVAADASASCESISGKLAEEYRTALAQTSGEVPPQLVLPFPGSYKGLWPHPLKVDYFSLRPPAAWKKPWRELRDWIRYRLQVIHGHAYPTLSLDEAPVARWWAEQAFKPKAEGAQMRAAVKPGDAENSEPFDKVQIEKDLMGEVDASPENRGYLGHVENFASEMETLLDEAVDIEVQIAALDKAMKLDKRQFHIELEWPRWERENGKLVVKKTTRYFGTKAKAEIERNELVRKRKEVSRRVSERGVQQAIMIRKIEVYTDELLSQMAQHKGTPLPQEYADFLARSRKLYQTEKRDDLIPKLKAPTWAWEKLKFQQFEAEIYSFMAKDIRLLKEKFGETNLKKAYDYFNSLSEKEKKALGLDDTKNLGGQWWKDLRWVRILTSLTGAAGAGQYLGVFEGFLDLVKLAFISDNATKIDCAEKETDKEYLDCAEIYLRDRFKSRFAASRENLEKLFNQEGTATDPTVALEIDDLTRRRKETLSQRYADEIIREETKKAVDLKNLDGRKFRSSVIKTADEVKFKQGVKIYLEFRYAPLVNDEKLRPAVNSVLEAKTAKGRTDALEKLKAFKNTNALVETLNQFFQDRQKFIDGGSDFDSEADVNDADEIIEEAAAKLVKEQPNSEKKTPR